MRVGGAVRDDRQVGHSLEAVPHQRRDDHERIVVGPQEMLAHLAKRGRTLSVVVEHQLHASGDARVVQCHVAMAMPPLYDVAIHTREVDLTELDEMRVTAFEHVVDGASLVGNSLERNHAHAVDHDRTRSSSRNRGSGIGTTNLPPCATYSRSCSRISPARFHASKSTVSGWRSTSASALTIGIPTPGMVRPCLSVFLSATNSMISGPNLHVFSKTVPLAAAP